MRLPSFRTISLASLAVGLAALASSPATLAADKIKVGYLSTLSGPNAQIGFDVRDGFNLAIKMNGGKLGTLPAEVIIADDQLNPDTGKQAVDRMLRRDRVDIVTGIIFSNVAVAVGPTIFESKTIYLSPNASPSQWAGAQCNPWFFSVSWPNESYHEAAGQYATDKGIKNVMFLAPNYPGGRDAARAYRPERGQAVLEDAGHSRPGAGRARVGEVEGREVVDHPAGERRPYAQADEV